MTRRTDAPAPPGSTLAAAAAVLLAVPSGAAAQDPRAAFQANLDALFATLGDIVHLSREAAIALSVIGFAAAAAALFTGARAGSWLVSVCCAIAVLAGAGALAGYWLPRSPDVLDPGLYNARPWSAPPPTDLAPGTIAPALPPGLRPAVPGPGPGNILSPPGNP